jgi:hypothetical protein
MTVDRVSNVDDKVPRVPTTVLADVQALWDYHNMGHQLRRADVGIGRRSCAGGVVCRSHVDAGWWPS